MGGGGANEQYGIKKINIEGGEGKLTILRVCQASLSFKNHYFFQHITFCYIGILIKT